MYVRRPCHFAFGPKGDPRANSACGIWALWDRGLSYTRDIEKTTCGHCLRWLRKEAKRQVAAQKANVIEGTAERLA